MPLRPARNSHRTAVFLAVSASLTVNACSASPEGFPAAGADGPDTVRVAANFYPVQFLAQRIGGRHASVDVLTPPGTEPHDLALSGPALHRLQSSDVVLYLGSSFQPDVERAVASLPEGTVTVDLLEVPGLDLLRPPAAGGGSHGDDHDHDPVEETGEKDPHVWLDPVRLKLLAEAAADAMAAADPSRADSYAANLSGLLDELDSLDRELEQQLDRCDRRTLLTSHAAFGYLAERYGLEQIAIAGLSPEDEPDAKTLGDLSKTASAAGVNSVFLEEQLNPALAETVADTIGATTRALSALEFDPGQGQDLITVMQDNGHQISEGLGCR